MKYRIVEVTENGERYYIIEKKILFFWKELCIKDISYINEGYNDIITTMKLKFNTQYEAEEVIKDYKTIKYKNIIINPFINPFNKVDYYIKYNNKHNKIKFEIGNIDYLKSYIDKMISRTTIVKRVVKVIDT